MEVTTVRVNQVNLTLDQPLLLNLSLEAGFGVHCFLGPNGVGKTLTNKLLGLLLPVTEGTISWNDLVVNPFPSNRLQYIRQIGYMAQHPVFLNKTVQHNVELPLKIRGITREERSSVASQYLKEFRLEELKDKLPQKLSIGQRQKVALLRSLIFKPSILILDEPTASLDPANTKWFEEYIRTLVMTEDLIIFWTTHDQFQAKRIGDTVAVFIDGTIMETGTGKRIFDHPRNEMVKAYLNGKLI